MTAVFGDRCWNRKTNLCSEWTLLCLASNVLNVQNKLSKACQCVPVGEVVRVNDIINAICRVIAFKVRIHFGIFVAIPRCYMLCKCSKMILVFSAFLFWWHGSPQRRRQKIQSKPLWDTNSRLPMCTHAKKVLSACATSIHTHSILC